MYGDGINEPIKRALNIGGMFLFSCFLICVVLVIFKMVV